MVSGCRSNLSRKKGKGAGAKGPDEDGQVRDGLGAGETLGMEKDHGSHVEVVELMFKKGISGFDMAHLNPNLLQSVILLMTFPQLLQYNSSSIDLLFS